MVAFDKYGQGYFVFDEFFNIDVVQDLSKRLGKVIRRFYNNKEVKIMDKLPVAKHLTDDEYKLFLNVYQLHNRSMGLAEREKYTLSHVVKIERVGKGKCLRVHYDNGDWYNYTLSGEWY